MHFFIKVQGVLFMLLVLLSSVGMAEGTLAKKEFDCVIMPSNVADLGSNSRGVISRIVVDRNDFVKQGHVIAILDEEVEQATVTLMAKKASDMSEIEYQKTNLAYAQREEVHAKKAYHDKAFSLHDFDKAKVTVQLAEIKLLQAQEKQILAKNKLRQAQAQLAHRTIRAPFSGVIMERFKTMGEYIDDDPVVRLAQLDPLYVELIVPVAQKKKIKEGMKAQVCTDKNAGKGWQVTVTQIDEVIDAASGTLGVRLLLPNPDYKIPAGLRCDLRFIDSNNTLKNTTIGATSRHD